MSGLRSVCIAATALILAAAASPVQAQSEFPDRTVRIIVPIPAGAAADTLPRMLAEKLSVSGNSRSSSKIASARPSTSAPKPSPARSPTATRCWPRPRRRWRSTRPLSKAQLPSRCFVPITVMATLPNVLMLHPSVPAWNLKELIAYAKANPGKLTYGSAGVGSTPHLTMEQLASMTGWT